MTCYGNLMFMTIKHIMDNRFIKGRAGIGDYEATTWVNWGDNGKEWRYETIIIPFPFEKVEKVG